MLKPKVGDLVRLKPMIVVQVNSTEFKTETGGDPYWLRNEDIEEILPHPLDVGDIVKWKIPGTGHGTIVALYCGDAWVRYGETENRILRETDLTRVDPDA